MLTQALIDKFVNSLKSEYGSKIQSLKLEYCVNRLGNTYLYLALIKIKKSHRNSGYGSKILKEIIRYSEFHQIDIKLWMTDICGSEIDRLYLFYKNYGFVRRGKKEDGGLIYKHTKNNW